MNHDELRNFIEIASNMLIESEQVVREEITIVENEQSQSLSQELEQQVNDLLFKLRSYQDPGVGEYSAGMEAGMCRAADMIENMMNRLRGN